MKWTFISALCFLLVSSQQSFEDADDNFADDMVVELVNCATNGTAATNEECMTELITYMDSSGVPIWILMPHNRLNTNLTDDVVEPTDRDTCFEMCANYELMSAERLCRNQCRRFPGCDFEGYATSVKAACGGKQSACFSTISFAKSKETRMKSLCEEKPCDGFMACVEELATKHHCSSRSEVKLLRDECATVSVLPEKCDSKLAAIAKLQREMDCKLS